MLLTIVARLRGLYLVARWAWARRRAIVEWLDSTPEERNEGLSQLHGIAVSSGRLAAEHYGEESVFGIRARGCAAAFDVLSGFGG